MTSFNQLAQQNRQKNSGGRYPDALAHAITLAIMLRKIAQEPANERAAMLIVALFLWLTQSWNNIKKVSDIPDFIRISGTTKCQENAFRTYCDGANSSAEYAHNYGNDQKKIYLWQPIPKYFNDFFQNFISNQNYHTPFLNPKTKKRLLNIMRKKWRMPPPLKLKPRVRKDVFHQYLIDCALADNTLTALIRNQIVSHNRKHHKLADHYQNSDSDRMRYQLYNAYNRYLSRLIKEARTANLYQHFDLINASLSTNLINEHSKVANYLMQKGHITQTVFETSNGSKQRICSLPLKIGSKRCLDEAAVVHFFSKLVDLVGSKPKRSDHKMLWFSYYCTATYRLALLFILLTGCRPTHSLSILKSYYWGDDILFIKDKGLLRQVIVCDYLQTEIRHYKKLQSSVFDLFGVNATLDELWFGIDDHGQPFRLSNRILRQFMHQHWPGVVPYQLRHFFAQSAVTQISAARLLDQDIDRLMGHASMGEHLGSDQMLPNTFKLIKTYLNEYAVRLRLKEFTYD
ncbi:MAG: hypothetical protein ACRCT7_04040 [Shewanella sp.]